MPIFKSWDKFYHNIYRSISMNSNLGGGGVIWNIINKIILDFLNEHNALSKS